MVEYTTSIYDDRVPPLVPATYVEDNDDVGQSTSQDDETNHPKISNEESIPLTSSNPRIQHYGSFELLPS